MSNTGAGSEWMTKGCFVILITITVPVLFAVFVAIPISEKYGMTAGLAVMGAVIVLLWWLSKRIDKKRFEGDK